KGTRRRDAGERTDVVIAILYLLMVAWLIHVVNSKTSLIGLSVGILIAVGLRFSGVRAQFGAYAAAGILGCAALQLSFNVTEGLIAGAGRDTTLTGRTELWEAVLKMRVNSLVGAGFESFWLGERLKRL